MRRNRDDFPAKVKLDMALRVGHVCSNPDCMQHTVGPKTGVAGVSNTGKASHIRAAAPGGPRYDESMSPAERKSIDNGIWLCGSCATRIDNDPDGYKPELLEQWRASAEQRAKQRQGQKLLTDGDLQKQLKSVISAVPSPFARKAVAHATYAYMAYLKSLDPRFDVLVSQHGSETRVELKSLESVPLSMNFEPVNRDAANAALAELTAHGGIGNISVSSLTMEGSPLIAELLQGVGPGEIHLISHQRPASLRLWLRMPDGKAISLFSLNGSLSFGMQTHTVSVNSFADAVELSIRAPNQPGDQASADMIISVDLSKWDGTNLKRLDGPAQLMALFSGILDGARLMAEAFVEEHSLWKMDITLSDQIFVGQQYTAMAYAKHAQTLAEHLNISIGFISEYSFDSEELFDIARMAAIADGSATGSFNSDISVDVASNNLSELRALNGTEINLSFYQQEGKTIRIYGRDIRTPRVLVKMITVCPEIRDPGLQKLSIRALAGSQVRYSFLEIGTVDKPEVAPASPSPLRS